MNNAAPDVIRRRRPQGDGASLDGQAHDGQVTTGVFVYENPANGHREEVGGMVWLWALLFGWVYLLIKGLFVHVLAWIVVAFFGFLFFGEAGFLVVAGLNIFYSIAVQSMIRASYLRKGWVEVEYGRASDPVSDRRADERAHEPASVADELEKLSQLRDSGYITAAEFQKLKDKLIT